MKKRLSVWSFVLLGLFFIFLSTPVRAASGNEPQGPEMIYESAADVSPILKEAILSRAESLTVSVKLYPVEGEDIYQQAMFQAADIENGVCVHTGNPIEGDYLRPYTSNHRSVETYENGDHYINMMKPVMADDKHAYVFTDEGKFISQDCRHLTQAGAQFYSKVLPLDVILKER